MPVAQGATGYFTLDTGQALIILAEVHAAVSDCTSSYSGIRNLAHNQ